MNFLKIQFYSIRIESKHQVTLISGLNEFMVKFAGPRESKFQCKNKIFFIKNSFSLSSV
jgi:hypothetical protein